MNLPNPQKLLLRRNKPVLEGPYRLAFLFLSIFYLEVILRINTGSAFFNDGLLYSYLFAGATAMLIELTTSFLRGKVRHITAALMLFMVTLFFASQLIYFKIFKTFYSVYSAANGAQVTEFIQDILEAVWQNGIWLILLFLPLAALLFFTPWGEDVGDSVSWKERGFTALLAALLFGAALFGINTGDREVNSAWDLYYRNNYPVASVNRLGLITSMRLDLKRTLNGFEAPPPEAELLEPSLPETTEPSGSDPLNSSDTTSAAEAASLYPKNVMAIDYEKIIAETKDEKLKNMHTYFSRRQATRQNEYTGKFKGYNLILITAEGFSHYAVDKEVTPTLYKMSQEGFHFTDFYNPIWGVSTSDGEYVATTGLIPKNGVWSLYKSGSISMPFAMGNQFRHLDYKTMAYHNHTYDYYRRDVSHPNLGYNYKGLGNGLKVRPTWPESDLEMMEVTIDEYIADQPFHTYYMTVSGHMDYEYSGNFMASKNRDLVADLPYLEAGKAYMATQIELDRALEHLLKRLEEEGIADKTLIAISADHYPYGLKKKEIDDLAGHTVEDNFELYKSSFILYAKGMKPETIQRPVSSLDIIPTISNLMGLEYDSRLLMGVDIFSDTPPLVIFENHSFISDVGRYNSITREFTLNKGVTMTEAQIEAYRKKTLAEIDRQFYYSGKILDTDYYSLVIQR